MASLESVEYALINSVPSSNLKPTQKHGRKRTLNASITLAAEASIADTIEIGYLPAGAKLLDARVVAPSDGTTGQLDIGWTDNGTDGADQDGIFAGASEVDTGGGAVDAKMLGTAAGYRKEFSKEVLLQGYFVEATTASSGDTIEFEFTYVVD